MAPAGQVCVGRLSHVTRARSSITTLTTIAQFISKVLISRRTSGGPGRTGLRNGHFLIQGLISGSTRNGSARTGVRHGHFLIKGLLAEAPAVAPAGLGLGVVMFLLRGIKHHRWLRLDWGGKCSVCY